MDNYGLPLTRITLTDTDVVLRFTTTLQEPIDGHSSFVSDINIPIELAKEIGIDMDIVTARVNERVAVDVQEFRDHPEVLQSL